MSQHIQQILVLRWETANHPHSNRLFSNVSVRTCVSVLCACPLPPQLPGSSPVPLVSVDQEEHHTRERVHCHHPPGPKPHHKERRVKMSPCETALGSLCRAHPGQGNHHHYDKTQYQSPPRLQVTPIREAASRARGRGERDVTSLARWPAATRDRNKGFAALQQSGGSLAVECGARETEAGTSCKPQVLSPHIQGASKLPPSQLGAEQAGGVASVFTDGT